MSCLPIYKTISAICNTPLQTQCVRNSIFPLVVMVITCCGPSCGLWCVSVRYIEGAPKIFRKLLGAGIIAVEKSCTGPATTVLFFSYSWHLRAFGCKFYGSICLRTLYLWVKAHLRLNFILRTTNTFISIVFLRDVKSHFDNDSLLSIYKTILAICNTPRKIQCVMEFHFSALHHIMIPVVGRVVVCGCVSVC